MSLTEELRGWSKAVNICISEIEHQEVYLEQLKSRKTTLKSKSCELDAQLRELLLRVEDRKKLKSDLLEIKNEVQAKSKSNLAAGKKLSSLQNDIGKIRDSFVSKDKECVTLSAELEKLRMQNGILKQEKEELLKRISEYTDLKNAYLEKMKRASNLKERNLQLENELKELDAQIINLLKRQKLMSRPNILGGDKSPTNGKSSAINIPIKLFNDFHRSSGIVCSHNHPEGTNPSQNPSSVSFRGERLREKEHGDAEEEIFITDPPFQSRSEKGMADSEEALRWGAAATSKFLPSNSKNFRVEANIFGRNNSNDNGLASTNDRLRFEPIQDEKLRDEEQDSLESLWRRKPREPDSSSMVSELKKKFEEGNDFVPVTEKSQSSDGVDPVKEMDETDGTFHRRKRKDGVIRRHASLGDLSNGDMIVSLLPKRWSHQLELCRGGGALYLAPSKRTGPRGNLRRKRRSAQSISSARDKRVTFDPVALLFNAAVEGELNVIIEAIEKLGDIDAGNEDGMRALHYAIFAEHFHVVTYLVEEGCDVNAPDVDGWTPLHCAASCNDIKICELLIENGAAPFAMSFDDAELPSDKCDEMEPGFQETRDFLLKIEGDMGMASNGVVYALYDYEAEDPDELSFRTGDGLIVLRKGDVGQEGESYWWWGCREDREGYLPRNLVGMYPRVVPSRKM